MKNILLMGTNIFEDFGAVECFGITFLAIFLLSQFIGKMSIRNTRVLSVLIGATLALFYFLLYYNNSNQELLVSNIIFELYSFYHFVIRPLTINKDKIFRLRVRRIPLIGITTILITILTIILYFSYNVSFIAITIIIVLTIEMTFLNLRQYYNKVE